MTTPFVIGLTGGIGSGKSTIEKLFQEQGNVGVVDTDKIAHDLQQPGKAGYMYIRQAFGESVIDLDNSINRPSLRKIVFNDKEKKAKLESIMSPLIYHVATEQLAAKANDFAYLIFSVPLLVESKLFSKLVDRILVVDCPEAVQIERVMKRNNMKKAEVQKILDAQSLRHLRIMKADDIIENYNCLPEDNRKIVEAIHAQYLRLADEKKLAS